MKDLEAKVIQPLRRARLAPDDLHEARLAAAIDERLDAAAQQRAGASEGPTRRRKRIGRWWALASLPVFAGAAVLVLRLSSPMTSSSIAGGPVSSTEMASAHTAPERRALAIVREDGLGETRTLQVAAGSKVRARVGSSTELTLVGPAALAAFAVDDATELELTSGRLLVDFDGRGGGRLRVRSPGAVTTVVGTLFAVEARGRTSRVAVARGAVKVETVAEVRRVMAGQAWRTDVASGNEPLADALAAELVLHDRGLASDPVIASSASDSPRVPPKPVHADAHGKASAGAGASLESDYAAAEDLMRVGANAEARKALLALVAAHPHDPRAEVALLDLARLAHTAGHPAEARSYLARLEDTSHDEALLALARRLRQHLK